ncbi:Anp1-domain-containing protein [Hyaloraphidium curvatum]|nr:Anp1-domain-containing protein [Hyaloraphidium curvatum]
MLPLYSKNEKQPAYSAFGVVPEAPRRPACERQRERLANIWGLRGIHGAMLALYVTATLLVVASGLVVLAWSAFVFAGGDAARSPAAAFSSAPKLLIPRDGTTTRFPNPYPRQANDSYPTVLVLTPVKNSAEHLGHFFSLLESLDYPSDRISIGVLDSDSDDVPDLATASALLSQGYRRPEVLGTFSPSRQRESGISGTLASLLASVPLLHTAGFGTVTVVRHDFNYSLPRDARHDEELQGERRAVMARSRNHLLSSALGDEEFVLWIDSDVSYFPRDVLLRLLETGKDIVVPHCVIESNGSTYDRNSWRAEGAPGSNATADEVRDYWDARTAQSHPQELWVEGYYETGNVHLDGLRNETLSRLDGVGGAMLLVRAEHHRQGLVFPPYVYRGRIETEGLAMAAMDMGVLSWGLPNLEIVH